MNESGRGYSIYAQHDRHSALEGAVTDVFVVVYQVPGNLQAQNIDFKLNRYDLSY